MKIILYIALLCLSSIAFSQENSNEFGKSTNANLTFGRYGKDCSGRGTCSFTTGLSQSESNTEVNYNNNNTISITIDRSKITQEDEFKIVGKQFSESSETKDITFIMEEDLILDGNAKRELNILSHTKIAKGVYSIIVTKDVFTITLMLE